MIYQRAGMQNCSEIKKIEVFLKYVKTQAKFEKEMPTKTHVLIFYDKK